MKKKKISIYLIFLIFLIVLLLDFFGVFEKYGISSMGSIILFILVILMGIHSWFENRKNKNGLKNYIKTTRKNYILNISISGIIALIVGILIPFKFAYDIGGPFPWFFIVPTLFIFHHFFRAGECILTKKVLTIPPNLFEGYEENKKRAKGLFIYYLTTATLLSLFILYLFLFHNW